MNRPSREAGLRALARVTMALPVLAALTVVSSATRLGPSTPGCAQAASMHHAALVVEHADGHVVTACVAFAAASLTGEQLLQQSGIEFATEPYGGSGDAVCQVDGEPAQYPASCWTANSPYWALYVSRGGGAWQFSSLGVSSQSFGGGDAEGLRYESQAADAPPASPAGVCPPSSTASPTQPARSTPPASHGSSQVVARGVVAPSPSALPATSAAAAAPSTSTSPSRSTTRAATGATPAPSSLSSSGVGLAAALVVVAGLVALLVRRVVQGRGGGPRSTGSSR